MQKKFIIVFLIAAAVFFFYWLAFSPINSGNKNPILFQIKQGQSWTQVAENLENANLIRSDKAFLVYAKFAYRKAKIYPGRYRIPAGPTIKEIIKTITNPDKTEISVTIPEGLKVRDIDKRLTDMGLIIAGEFTFAAEHDEGFLFPDTYNVYNSNFKPEDLIKKMKDNFLKKLTPDLLKEIEKQKRTLSQIITMASILEKEIKTEKDLAIAAGILWKRLDNAWPLQTDATLLYGKDITAISAKELTEDNPYNTYKYKGLPPTPIGNPGIKTIRAAIFPENSPYWFYLTDAEGNIHYAVSNEDQNENRRKYIE
ncbi:endolytic transglycosylase MltG [Candidatus Peregrinibacteria bacterium]|nr:endolytic transglycosylase MltG [Candidatus Peregrinibacteria bacterium]